MNEPSLEYLLFCDKIINDRNDGKDTCVGIFHSLCSGRLPIKTEAFYIKVSIKNLIGAVEPYQIVINIRNPKTGVVVGSTATRIAIHPTAENSGRRLKLSLRMAPVTFGETGKYEGQLLIENQVIGRRLLEVVLLPKG